MFKGLYTALITPFKDGKIDIKSLENLLEKQIEARVSGVVIAGTTGESPTLSHDEHNDLLKISLDIVAKRIQVIAGTGSNSTAEALSLTKYAEEIKSDAALIVTPYYNKPTQRGLYEHFKVIHDATNIPIILYNIPGRSVVNMSIDLIKKLSLLPRIIGIKDATGDLSMPLKVKEAVGNKFIQVSGEDGTALEFNQAGGQGCISVTSNIIPELCVKQQNYFFNNDIENANKMKNKLVEINEVLFCETNPMPVKYAASLLGLCSSELRLPLVEIEESSKTKVRQALKNLSLI
jgi:4-hydroxy-tetrahydrodipicolinate synthase